MLDSTQVGGFMDLFQVTDHGSRRITEPNHRSKKRIQIETYIYILFLLSVFALRPATSYDSHPSVIASTAVIKGI